MSLVTTVINFLEKFEKDKTVTDTTTVTTDAAATTADATTAAAATDATVVTPSIATDTPATTDTTTAQTVEVQEPVAVVAAPTVSTDAVKSVITGAGVDVSAYWDDAVALASKLEGELLDNLKKALSIIGSDAVKIFDEAKALAKHKA